MHRNQRKSSQCYQVLQTGQVEEKPKGTLDLASGSSLLA